jgi:hypothetical protein
MALEWNGDSTPNFQAVRPIHVEATKTRDNLTLAYVNFTMKSTGWEFSVFRQEAPPAVRSIREV